MLETEDKIKSQDNYQKTIETGTLEETIEATKESNKYKKHPEISIPDENNKKIKKPKKTKLTKTLSSL